MICHVMDTFWKRIESFEFEKIMQNSRFFDIFCVFAAHFLNSEISTRLQKKLIIWRITRRLKSLFLEIKAEIPGHWSVKARLQTEIKMAASYVGFVLNFSFFFFGKKIVWIFTYILLRPVLYSDRRNYPFLFFACFELINETIEYFIKIIINWLNYNFCVDTTFVFIFIN